VKENTGIDNNFDLNNEVIEDPFFKKAQGLKKILRKYTNKTFTLKEENLEINYEVEIKI
jgi:hypothetical protein